MKNVIRKLWNDEAGFIVSVELILVATILVIGLVAGMTQLRDAVLSEFADMAAAFGAVDQSYAVNGVTYNAGEAASSGFNFVDAVDAGDTEAGAGVGMTAGVGLAVGTDYTGITAGLDGAASGS
jgi:Flp pilus assembly pilin Flp